MTEHPDMLPECVEREAANTALFREFRNDIKAVREAVVGNGNTKDSLVATLNRHAAYWKIFAIIAALLTLGCTVAGTIYAATK